MSIATLPKTKLDDRDRLVVGNQYWLSHPVEWTHHVLGTTPWSKQREILDALATHDLVTVRSGQGVGKTFTASEAVLWFLYTRRNSIVITTAPTWRQVETIMWSSVRQLWRGAGYPMGGRCLQTKIDIGDGWFAMGVSTDEPEAFTGFHAHGGVMVVIDEASGVSDVVKEAVDSITVSAGCKVLAISNPTRPVGWFYDTFKSPMWHNIHISCLDSPNIQAGREVVPGLVSKDWLDARKVEWGEDSSIYRVRVLGEFPESGSESLFPVDILESSVERGKSVKRSGEVKLGVDVARYGSDRTVFVSRDDAGIIDIQVSQGQNLMDTVGRTQSISRTHGISDRDIYVDDCGLGGGVTDRLKELGLKVNAVNAGANAVQSDRFANVKAEMYFELSKAVSSGFALPEDKSLIYELSEMRAAGFTSRGQQKIESKDELKKRIGRSPDLADALALSFSCVKKHIPIEFT